jgi:hypothetical protein
LLRGCKSVVSDKKKSRIIVKIDAIKKIVLKIFAGIGNNKKIETM